MLILIKNYSFISNSSFWLFNRKTNEKMIRKKIKPHYVGLRMDNDQIEVLSQLQRETNLSKTDILLKGLENLSRHYLLEEETSDLGLDQRPLSLELRRLEKEAIEQAEKLKKVKRRGKAIMNMVQELRDFDEIIDKYHCDKSALIQILLDIQTKNHWLPKPALMWISERLNIPMTTIRHIASFYKAFSLEPQGRHIVQVCTGTTCYVKGAPRLVDKITKILGIKPGETDPELKFTLKTVQCLGCCALGPVMTVDGKYYSNPPKAELEEIFDNVEKGEK